MLGQEDFGLSSSPGAVSEEADEDRWLAMQDERHAIRLMRNNRPLTLSPSTASSEASLENRMRDLKLRDLTHHHHHIHHGRKSCGKNAAASSAAAAKAKAAATAARMQGANVNSTSMTTSAGPSASRHKRRKSKHPEQKTAQRDRAEATRERSLDILCGGAVSPRAASEDSFAPLFDDISNVQKR